MFDFLSALGPAVPIVIIKADGTRGGAVARIMAKTAYIMGVEASIAGGDVVEQTLPSGATQSFDVVQTDVFEIPEPHLQVQLRPRSDQRSARGRPALANGLTVTITNSVVDGTVQVGDNNRATVTGNSRSQAAPERDEMREELLAVLDQAIATHRLVIDAADDVDAVRAGIDMLLARIDHLSGDVQMSKEAFRGVAELAATQVKGSLRPSLRTWLASHPTPIMQNIFASILFEAARAALGAG